MTRRTPLWLACAAAMGLSATAGAQVSDDVVKIGILNDQSGMMADLSGRDAVVAVEMAIEDFGGTVLGKPVEVISADHQNKVDIGLGIARKWYEQEQVDLILDVPNSAIALAVQDLTRQMDRIAIFASAGSSDLTGKSCSPNGIHWTYDTYALASGVASGVIDDGGKSWFFLTSDYAFGHALERDAVAVVEARGGEVKGTVRHPITNSDFSSFLLQAQASGAQVIGLSNGSADTVNSIKQAREFGITEAGQRLAALLFFITDVDSIGLEAAQGVNLVEAFYWDQNDETRQWSARFEERTGRKPTMLHASDYGATLHYLNAIQAAGTDAAGPVMAQMKATPINDVMTTDGYIREDGRVMRDMYLFEVKKPEESTQRWDYYHTVRTIDAESAFRPVEQSECSLLKKGG